MGSQCGRVRLGWQQGHRDKRLRRSVNGDRSNLDIVRALSGPVGGGVITALRRLRQEDCTVLRLVRTLE